MPPYQSLHLPGLLGPDLARDRQRCKRTAAFPEFERIRRAVSERDAPKVKRNLVLYPAELRGTRHELPLNNQQPR